MKVLVADEISPEGIQPLEDDPRISLDIRVGLTEAELHAIVGEYDAIVTRSGTKVDVLLLEHSH